MTATCPAHPILRRYSQEGNKEDTSKKIKKAY
jgi:hypothetical protein